jgi:UDP-2-acetamido-2-deoxy-ribo-hexuluronate aminotransferase
MKQFAPDFMSLPFIDLQTSFRQAEPAIRAAIDRVLEHGRFIMGPEVAELEKVLAEFLGVGHCVTVASGTDSLEIALRALNIGPGDEVITTPFTWISTAEVISLVGARPVFVDIEAESFNLDVSQLEAAITPQTKALLPVSLFGQIPAMEEINALAEKYQIEVIEDAAQSFGAARNGRRSGAWSRISSTSFFPAKPLGCYGDGGALFTPDDELADVFRALRNHGGLVRDHHTLVGMNGRFDTLQAAIMLAKWPDFAGEVAARGRIGARYSELLRGQPGIVSVPEVSPGNTHVYAQYTLRVEDREGLRAHLQAAGIPTAVYYPVCLHEQPVYRPLGYLRGDFPVAEAAAAQVVSIPMHPHLDEFTQDQIVAAIKQFYAKS